MNYEAEEGSSLQEASEIPGLWLSADTDNRGEIFSAKKPRNVLLLYRREEIKNNQFSLPETDDCRIKTAKGTR